MKEFLVLLILLTLRGNGQVKLALLPVYRESLVFYMNLTGTTPHGRCIINVRQYVCFKEHFAAISAYIGLKIAKQK